MSSQPRNILLTSASGNIGQCLVPLLLTSPPSPNTTLILPTRNASRIPLPPGTNTTSPPTASGPKVIIAEGDVSDALWLESLMRTHNIDTVLSNFTQVEELFLTLNLWSACERAGTVRHLIYISAAFDCGPEAVRNGALTRVGAAHCAYKFPAEQRLMFGKMPFTWTVLGPSLFFTNDMRSKETLLKGKRGGDPNVGFMGQPMGRVGCSRVDVADIALGVLRAIEDEGKVWGGKKIYIGTKETYTEEKTAEVWGKALGKKVVSGSAADRVWMVEVEKEIAAGMGNAWGRDMVSMYDQFDLDGFKLTDEQYQEQVKFLGKEASRYEDFVQKTANAWKTEA